MESYPTLFSLSITLAGNVADMSPTCRPDTVMSADYAKKGMSPRHDERQKESPTHPICVNNTDITNKPKHTGTIRFYV